MPPKGRGASATGGSATRPSATSIGKYLNSQDPPAQFDFGALIQKLDSLTNEVKDIKQQSVSTREILEEVREIKKDMKQMKKDWEEEKQQLQFEIKLLKDKEERREKNEKRKNLIIRGKDVGNTPEQIQNFLQESLGVNEEVKEVRKVNGRQKQEMCVVKMKTVEGKINILKVKGEKLKGTDVSITGDSTYNERATQRYLKEAANKMREEGKVVVIKHLRIESEGKVYKWSSSNDCVEEIKRKTYPRHSQDFQVLSSDSILAQLNNKLSGFPGLSDNT